MHGLARLPSWYAACIRGGDCELNMHTMDWQSPRTPQLQNEMVVLRGAESHLWSTGAVILIVFTAGFMIMAVPAIFWSPGELPQEALHRLQSVAALLTLLLIFAAYTYDQRRKYQRTHSALVREIVFSERMASYSTIDPLTQVFNRPYLDHVLPREVSRANRQDSRLSFLLLELESHESTRRKFGDHVADQLLVDTALLLKGTFRGSDIIVRYRHASFLVILPETNQHQASCALRRLLANADHWNVDRGLPYEIWFNGASAGYSCGANVTELLETLERCVGPYTISIAGD